MLCFHGLGSGKSRVEQYLLITDLLFSSKRIESQIQDTEGQTDKKRTEV